MKRMNRKKVSLAVRQAISAGVVFGLAAPMVHAQQAATTPPVQTLEKVEVTGSRITSATFESASPINTITAQDIAITGLQSTANIINQLPQAFADQGGNISNGADGHVHRQPARPRREPHPRPHRRQARAGGQSDATMRPTSTTFRRR